METLQEHAETLQQACLDIQNGRRAEAAEKINAVLLAVPEPPQWGSPMDPPSDLGAWHWVWMAQKALSGAKGLPNPETALETALDLLGFPSEQTC